MQDDETAKASIITQEMPDPGPGNLRVFLAEEPKKVKGDAMPDESDNESLLDRELLKEKSHKFEMKKMKASRKGTGQ